MKYLLMTFLALLMGSQGLKAQQMTPAIQQGASQRKSPLAHTAKKLGDVQIDIQYGSPTVKGRRVWGELVPFEEVWRTGANEATTFQVSHDVLVEGQLLPAGRYSLFTVPHADGRWTVIFNKVPDQWGAYNYDAAQDALRVEVSAVVAAELSERLVIDVREATQQVVIAWELLEVPFSIVQAPN
jgi:hypothetical protein